MYLNYKLPTKISCLLFIMLSSFSICRAQSGVQRVGMESDEYIEIEAENFEKQTANSKRSWHLTTKNKTPRIRKDPDENHWKGSSNDAYIELLPDTLYDGNEKKVEGKNYSREPGKVAVLTYNVNFKTSGRFYVWVRGYSTGDEDNSVHVGVDNKWPKTGQGLYVCTEKRNKWSWSSHQFNKSEKCGKSERIFITINKPGNHKIMFSMREDGFEFDKFVLTKKFTKQLM